MERGFKGIWIPKDIWFDKVLSWSEKLMLVEIDSLDCGDGCYASNEYFMDFFSLSESRVSHIISGLKKKGYIEIEMTYKTGTRAIDKRIIKLASNHVEKAIQSVPEVQEPEPVKKPKEYAVFEAIWKQYPHKMGKKSVAKKSKDEIEKIGLPRMEIALQKYLEYVQSQRDRGFPLQYKNGSTFFNSGYLDFLPDEEPEIEVETTVTPGRKWQR